VKLKSECVRRRWKKWSPEFVSTEIWASATPLFYVFVGMY
jgi:hypothetical protein